MVKELDIAYKRTIDQLKQASDFHQHAAWLLDLVPIGKLADVPDLVKLVREADIAVGE